MAFTEHEEYRCNKEFIDCLKALGKHIDLCYMKIDGTLMIHQGTIETLIEVYEHLVDMRGNDK